MNTLLQRLCFGFLGFYCGSEVNCYMWAGPCLFVYSVKYQSVQWLSHVRLFATSWTAACQASLSIKFLEPTQTHVHRISDAIQLSVIVLTPLTAFYYSSVPVFLETSFTARPFHSLGSFPTWNALADSSIQHGLAYVVERKPGFLLPH